MAQSLGYRGVGVGVGEGRGEPAQFGGSDAAGLSDQRSSQPAVTVGYHSRSGPPASSATATPSSRSGYDGQLIGPS